MRGWRIEDLDPPAERPRRRNDAIAVAVLALGISLVLLARSGVSDRVATPNVPASVPSAAIATPAPEPVTFVMRSTGMASGGFWCQAIRGSARLPDLMAPPDRLIVVVTTDQSAVAPTIDCEIPSFERSAGARPHDETMRR